jgi:hypothetical protein
MTREQNLAEIREAVVEALCAHGTRSEQVRYRASFDREIRLADVLLAMDAADKNIYVHRTGAIIDFNAKQTLQQKDKWGAVWNLRKDDVTLQSDPCVAFIAGLLAKKTGV